MAGVIALVDDIFFQARISEVAKKLGGNLRVVRTPEALMNAVSSELPVRVIVDLNARVPALEAIRGVRASHPQMHIVGYLSHVQTDLAAAAREAGCDEVMPRSKFTQQLATLLAS